jgi:large repetitive protein
MPDSPQQSTDIAFVFDDVANYQELVAAFRPGVEVHVLDSTGNGLVQMAELLQGRSGIGTLQIVGHGSEASLDLGSLTLTAQNIGESSALLAHIGASLATGGDILLYGCDVAAGPAGARFVGQIAQATGADVAASTDPTGAAALGGNWTLEFQTGPIVMEGALTAAAAANFNGLLATNEDVTSTMDNSPGNFVPGFTLTTAQTVYGDAANGVNGGIYFDTLTESESFTVSADAASVGSFDLAGMTWVKAFTFGEFTIAITGHKMDGSIATAAIYTAQNASTFSVTDDFSDMTGLTSFDVQITGTSTDSGAGSTPADLTLDAFTVNNIVAPNVVPAFVGGTTTIGATENVAIDASAVLHVSDTDSGETLTWTQQSAPSHGALSLSGATASSGGTNIAPGGSITYTPAAGYAGSDTFTVKISDGTATATRTVTVNVNPSTPSAPDLASASDSGASSADNVTNAASLSFSGSGASGDSASSVRVFIDQNGNGTYDAGTDTTGTAVMTNGAWTVAGLSTSGITDGTYHVYAQATSATGGLVSALSAPLSVTIDHTAPAMTITSDVAALKIGETSTITFTFSQDPGSTFTSGDVAVTGGTLSALAGTGLTRTAVFTPDAGINGGTAGVTVAAGSYADVAGNDGGAGASPSLTFDTLAPAAPSTPALTGASDTGVSASDNLTKVATPTFVGTAEAGAQVKLYDGATQVGSGTADGSGNWSLTSSMLADGTHSITAVAMDAAGNGSPASAAQAVTIDSVVPTLAITSDVAALKAGESATITFTFSEDPGASFTLGDVSVGGGTLGALSGTGTTLTAAFTPTASTDAGTASITVGAGSYTDAAGNNGGAGSTPSLHFDTLAPTLAITSDVAALKIGETATVTFTFSEDPGASFTLGDVAVGGGTLSALAGTGLTRTAVFTPTANTNGGTASITVGAGSYTDAAGNGGGAGSTPSLYCDTLAPTLAITSDVATLKIGETAAITFTFSEDPGASFSWDGTAGDIAVTGGTLSAIAGTGATRTAVFTPDANTNGGTAGITVAHGSYTDAAGNGGGAGATPSLGFDTLAPSAPSAPVLTAASDSGASASDGLTKLATPTFTGTAEAAATVTLYDGATQVGSATADGSGNWSITSSTLSEGSHAITAVATDAAGNVGVASAACTIAIDSSAPAAPAAPTLTAGSDTGSSSADHVTSDAMPTITGTAEAGSNVTLYDTDGTTVLGSAVATGGAWSITSTALGDGAHTLTVTATDTAGNESAASGALAVTIDTVAPAAPSAPVLAPGSGTNSSTPTLTGTAEAGSTVTLYDTDGSTVLGSAVATSGTWSITTSPIVDGAHTFSVHATDLAGNVGAISAGLAVAIDTTPPPPPVPGPVQGTAGNDQLTGTPGNDTIDGLGGNDTIDGGPGTDTVVVRTSVSDVLSYSIDDHGVATLTTSLGTQTLINVERVQFDDALFALDTSPGGHVWNAAALYHAAYGLLPGLADLSQWTAAADASSSLDEFAQKMLDLHAPGITTHDLVVDLYEGVLHQVPSEATVQYYVDQVGPGKAFAAQAELAAYAVAVLPNVEALAAIVGTVQHLDASAF